MNFSHIIINNGLDFYTLLYKVQTINPLALQYDLNGTDVENPIIPLQSVFERRLRWNLNKNASSQPCCDPKEYDRTKMKESRLST